VAVAMQAAVPLWKVIADFGRQDCNRARKGPVFSLQRRLRDCYFIVREF
jgi:hypothetical protein